MSKQKKINNNRMQKQSKANGEETPPISGEEEILNQTEQELEEESKEEEKELYEEEKFRQIIAESEEKIAALQDRYLRQIAEFDNYRKRTVKEKAELIKNGGERIMEAVLPILDDFERAIQNLKKEGEDNPSLDGVELIYQKFIGILKQQGLQKIETEGKDFDTDYHEAITLIPAPSEELKGKVLDCVQTGYMLNDKVIRHAKVAVGE